MENMDEVVLCAGCLDLEGQLEEASTKKDIVTEMENHILQLVYAVHKYGKHAFPCPVTKFGSKVRCDCGFQEALKL